MNLYVATLYFEAIGYTSEYFTTLNALEKSLKASKIFIRGTVAEYSLSEDEYTFNKNMWMIAKNENGIKFTQIN